MSSQGSATTTRPKELPLSSWKRSAWARRVTVSCFILLIGAAAFGFLGLRMSWATASGSGYDLRVQYPRIARPGISAPILYEVRHPGGFDGPIKIATSLEYLTIFDNNL